MIEEFVIGLAQPLHTDCSESEYAPINSSNLNDPFVGSARARPKIHRTSTASCESLWSNNPYSPTGTSVGPNTMANGGIQQILAGMNTDVRVAEVALTSPELTEYGAWKKLGWALGHFSDIVAKNERDGYFYSRPISHLPIDAGTGRGPATFRAEREAAEHRHALARRASRFQYA